ncbi:hypothetical protein Csa_009295 [Cucumis sativus]|uniref:Uncharacterized protein n=1 Tax=Cucumis sativus TaxID=3659 RepID=A0A0A0KTX1_CUCSA|nr:hypothetical protein Csa_009295 [Cucumis sativus]
MQAEGFKILVEDTKHELIVDHHENLSIHSLALERKEEFAKKKNLNPIVRPSFFPNPTSSDFLPQSHANAPHRRALSISLSAAATRQHPSTILTLPLAVVHSNLHLLPPSLTRSPLRFFRFSQLRVLHKFF